MSSNKVDPIFAKDRNDIEEPMCTKSKMERLLARRPIPKTDRELPKRLNPRKDNELPMCTKSIADREEPRRVIPYTEKVEPNLKNERKLTLDPTWQ